MSKVSPRTIGLIFGLIFVSLICALAYNMGGSAEQIQTNNRLSTLRDQLDRETGRKDDCEQREHEQAAGKDREDAAARGMDESIRQQQDRTSNVAQTIMQIQAQVDDCEAERQQKIFSAKNSPTADLSKRLVQTRNSLAAAQKTLLDANSNRTRGDKDLLRLVFAYIQANTRLSRELKQKQQVK